jgi:hypothetical protein
LKNVDQSVLFNYLRELPLQSMQQFVDLIQLCVSIFEHKPQSESFLSDVDTRRHSNAAVDDFGTLKGPKISAGGNYASIRWRKNPDMTMSRYLTTNGKSKLQIAINGFCFSDSKHGVDSGTRTGNRGFFDIVGFTGRRCPSHYFAGIGSFSFHIAECFPHSGKYFG